MDDTTQNTTLQTDGAQTPVPPVQPADTTAPVMPTDNSAQAQPVDPMDTAQVPQVPDLPTAPSATPADAMSAMSQMAGQSVQSPAPVVGPPPAPVADVVQSTPSQLGPVTNEELMEELQHIEDRLDEMDEKL